MRWSKKQTTGSVGNKLRSAYSVSRRMIWGDESTIDSDGGENKRLNMESKFSQAALDIIGISVFNYDFKALTSAAPVIQATYTALKEVETRSMDLLPTWRLPEPFLYAVSPRQRAAMDAVAIIQEVTSKLVEDAKKMVEEEEAAGGAEAWARDYLNDANPSVLRYLIAAREEVSSTQLRDDLLSLLGYGGQLGCCGAGNEDVPITGEAEEVAGAAPAAAARRRRVEPRRVVVHEPAPEYRCVDPVTKQPDPSLYKFSMAYARWDPETRTFQRGGYSLASHDLSLIHI